MGGDPIQRCSGSGSFAALLEFIYGSPGPLPALEKLRLKA